MRNAISFMVVVAAFANLALAADPDAQGKHSVDLTKIERKIGKLPPLKSENPLYGLLVFGMDASKRVWLVRDDDVLYVDRNGNGDLTEQGERVAADPKESKPGENVFSFRTGDIPDGPREHKDLHIGWMKVDHLQGMNNFQSLLTGLIQFRACAITVDVEMPDHKGAGLDGRVQQAALVRDEKGLLVFGSDPERAPIIHFDGPWEVTLSGKEQWNVGRRHAVYLVVGTPGVGPGTTAMVAFDKVIPAGLQPTMQVAYPSASAGEAGSKQSYVLTERCCGYNLFGDIHVPADVAAGKAQVEISLDSWPGAYVASTRHEVTILPARPTPKLNPISPRLAGRLPHVSSSGSITSIQFSPDGKRLIAGNYPGGIVHVWEVANNKRLLTFETGSGHRGSADYLAVSPNWQQVYAPTNTRGTFERVQQDGKTVTKVEYQDLVQEWDLASGKLLRKMQCTPPHGIRGLDFSPDGTYFLTSDDVPAVFESNRPRALTYWDVATGKDRQVAAGNANAGAFSTDGKFFAATSPQPDDDSHTHSIKIHSAPDLKEHCTIVLPGKFCSGYPWTFALDNSVLVGTFNSYAKADDWQNYESALKIWDANTGEEVMSIPAGKTNDRIGYTISSPDGRTILATASGPKQEHMAVFVVDVAKRATQRIVFDGENIYTGKPVFHPSGKWFASAVQVLPKMDPRSLMNLPIEELPQPHIDCIDTVTGKVIESLMAPQAWIESMAFGPDGNTLATSGNGEVLLWDIQSMTTRTP